jgi:hypothetical protein
MGINTRPIDLTDFFLCRDKNNLWLIIKTYYHENEGLSYYFFTTVEASLSYNQLKLKQLMYLMVQLKQDVALQFSILATVRDNMVQMKITRLLFVQELQIMFN